MNRKILLSVLFVIISMVINAQDSNSSTFYRNKLLGKKWTMNKNDNGQYYAFTLVFSPTKTER